jgi:glucose-1-phosphate adenylyltransferase
VRSIIGNNSKLNSTLMMGADFFQSHQERSDNIENGTPPIGVGANCNIKKAIIDKNARIGRNVQLINKDEIKDSTREEEGIWIRDGIIVIAKNTVIPDGTII